MNKSHIIRLVGIGFVRAKPAGDLKIGDVVRWNYGATSKVVAIERETAKSIKFRFDKGYLRMMRKTRLVGV